MNEPGHPGTAHEEELPTERARLAAVVEQIPAGLMILGSDGRVVIANAVARRLLGDGIERLSPFTSEAVEDGRAEVVRDDGSHLLLDVSMAPIVDVNERQVGAVQLFQDVSVRTTQERAERDFVTNAAHQLQSPLAGIISAVEVLQAGAKDRPERDTFLGHIEQEANRLARLTRALLILARAQTGVETPKDEVVALEPLLTEIRAGLRPAPGVRIELDCPPELALVTNRELVEQALLNLAENSAKYTSEGQITLAARPLDGGAEIVVADTGPGIPRLEHGHVMERFYRGEDDGSDGFGLGLAIVRSAIEALDGELDLDEPEGSGTVVRIRLHRTANVVTIA